MGIWIDQIEKAKARSADFDLRALVKYAKDKPPAELGTPEQLIERQQFLAESLGNARETKEFYERIIAGNELQDVNFLSRGARAARAVGRIIIRSPSSGQLTGHGTGFLIAPGVLVTNNHVLPESATANRSQVQFEYEIDIDGQALSAVTFAFEPSKPRRPPKLPHPWPPKLLHLAGVN